MKRILGLIAAFLACGIAYGLPLGNPSEASLMCDGLVYEGRCADFCQPGIGWCDAWSFRLGFYGDYVFNRHMKVDQGNTKDKDIQHTELYTNAGYLALNFWDRLDIFGTLGASNIGMQSNVMIVQGDLDIATVDGNQMWVESETDFSWSLGARGTFYECGCLALGAEAQYFYTRPEMKFLYTPGSSADRSVYPDFAEMKYREWQFGLGISYRIWNFVPYVGVKYARATLGFDDARISDVDGDGNLEFIPDLASQFHWGYAVGFSLVDCEKVSLTLEARYLDEKAVYVNGQIRF